MRGGTEQVLIPRENEKDLKEIPDKVTHFIQSQLVEHIDDVLKHALVLDDVDSLFTDTPSKAPNWFIKKEEAQADIHAPH